MKRIYVLICCLLSLFAKAQQISYAEYFVDSDPGPGAGVSIPVTNAADSVDITANISTNGLGLGFHRLYVRVRNTSGRWSMYELKTFYVRAAQPAAPGQIVAAEYFVDNDPGLNAGIPLNTGASGNTVTFTGGITIPALVPGFHRLFVRARDSSGRWSRYQDMVFYLRLPPTPPVTNIVAAEYYYDTEPGYGLGTAISTGAAADSVNISTTLATATLSIGFHQLFVRVRDNQGGWSNEINRQFYRDDTIPAQNHVIVAGEYYFDADPGYGQGVVLSTGAPADSVSFNNYIISIQSPGFHHLYVRVRDSQGRWSNDLGRLIFRNDTLPQVSRALVKGEYFFNTDPGLDNAIPITPSFAVSDSIDLLRSLSTAGLLAGMDTLYLRVKDSAGNWSFPMRKEFTVQLPSGLSDTDEFPRGIKLFPNPAKDIVFLQLETPGNGNVSVRILSLTGQELRSRELNGPGQWTLSLEGLVPGLYMTEIIIGGHKFIRPLVKN